MTTDAFERITKSTALMIFAVYTAGYLVVSIHHSEYGFTDLSPLRPHIVAAGLWFFLMVALPAYPTVEFAPRTPDFLTLSKWLYAYCVGWLASRLFFGWIFDFTAVNVTQRPHWWLAVGSALLWVILYLIARSTRFPKTIAGVSNLLLLLWLAWQGFDEVRNGGFGMNTVGLWLLCVGLLTYLTIYLAKTWGRSFDWSLILFLLLGGLLVFGTTYYPHIKSRWGGGESIPVLIYTSKDSPITPSQQIQALLIDESDAGFYFVPKGEAKALYLPRPSVALIYFGEQAKDSQLLSSHP